MASRIIEIWSEVIGEPEVGIWCDPSALPSAVKARFILGTGMRVLGDITVVRCLDCGRQKRIENPG